MRNKTNLKYTEILKTLESKVKSNIFDLTFYSKVIVVTKNFCCYLHTISNHCANNNIWRPSTNEPDFALMTVTHIFSIFDLDSNVIAVH